MKLLRCHVKRFGKLNDFTYEFDSELSTFNHENGWGKSTLATFIKAMFYGLNSQKRTVEKNERKKYMPWGSNDKFGGSIEFIRGDKQFKIERFFGAKESEDTITLTDMTTGKVFTEQENLGGRIFGIDEDGFMSTVYLSQNDFEIESNATITNKYNQKYGGVDDGNAYDNAINQLDKKIKELKRVGDKGIIADKTYEIKDINNQLEQMNMSESVSIRLKQDIISLETEKKRLEDKENALSNEQAKSSKARELLIKRKNYLDETAKLEESENELRNTLKTLNGVTCDRSELDSQFSTYNKLVSRLETKRAIEEDIKNIKTQVTKTPTKKEIPLKIIIAFVASAILLAIGGITLMSIMALGIVCLVLGSGAMAVGGIFLFLDSKNKNSSKDTALLEMLTSKQNSLKELDRIVEMEQLKLNEFLARFNRQNQNAYVMLNEIRDGLNNYSVLQERVKELKKSVELKESDPDFKEFIKEGDITASSVENIKNEIEQNRQDYQKVTQLLFGKRADLKRYNEFLESAVNLEEKRDTLKEELLYATQKYELLKKVKEFLVQADENLKIKYRAPLEESLNKYVKILNNADKKAGIDIDFKISVDENSGAKEVAYYSKGYKNLFDICRRFALIDVLFDKEKPFIILDDPFSNLDKGKISSAVELIKKLSKEYQIIYFVCHESRAV